MALDPESWLDSTYGSPSDGKDVPQNSAEQKHQYSSSELRTDVLDPVLDLPPKPDEPTADELTATVAGSCNNLVDVSTNEEAVEVGWESQPSLARTSNLP
jgi:hypothetical protein